MKLLKATLVLMLLLLVLVACSQETPADNSYESEAPSIQTFTLEELAAYDGQNGNPAYVAVEGIVYDVTDIPAWTGGKHNGNMAGQDVTEAISQAPHGKSTLEKLSVVGELVE